MRYEVQLTMDKILFIILLGAGEGFSDFSDSQQPVTLGIKCLGQNGTKVSHPFK